MSYIRQYKTKSGAIGVQICEKERGVVVKTQQVGSANSDGELRLLLKKAQRIIDHNRTPLFDLEDFDHKYKYRHQ
ncbi:hypothetical protein IJG79_03030 [Candidatus Saccharibacteria bacterium]|nr:hypothetical protein [Candidatus Saccharibacteria bacterium]